MENNDAFLPQQNFVGIVLFWKHLLSCWVALRPRKIYSKSRRSERATNSLKPMTSRVSRMVDVPQSLSVTAADLRRNIYSASEECVVMMLMMMTVELGYSGRCCDVVVDEMTNNS